MCEMGKLLMSAAASNLSVRLPASRYIQAAAKNEQIILVDMVLQSGYLAYVQLLSAFWMATFASLKYCSSGLELLSWL